MNNNSKIKILFFTPFAGYTGSEVMIFNMLRNMDPQKFEVAVFSMCKGELFDTLPINVYSYYYKSSNGLLQRIINKFYKLFLGKAPLERQLMYLHGIFKPDIWYLNTLLLVDVMQIAQKKRS